MAKFIDLILKEVLLKVEPKKEEIEKIESVLRDLLKKIKDGIKRERILAEVFVGGSYAKGTLVRKDYYDIDIFVRFEKRYKSIDISNLTERIIKLLNFRRVHGSRDYFRVEASKEIFFEIIPVKKITNAKDVENVTDLSFFHVNYIKRKIKSKKLLDDIRLSKAFCHANNCYGAESYISGFSGYSLELLVYYYRGFINFLKAMGEISDKKKLIIDIEKHYKNKDQILIDVNSAKLQSPIILIDPTYKQRNVLAALSQETFRNFQSECKKFLKRPSIKAFEPKKLDFNSIKNTSKNKGYEFVLVEVSTDRQEGDIAGSKLLKFYKHLSDQIEKFFEIRSKGFQYEKGDTARFFFVVCGHREVLVRGPFLKQKQHVKKFRQKYGRLFIKNNRLYAKYKISRTLNQFLKDWKQKYRKQILDMAIKQFEIIDWIK